MRKTLTMAIAVAAVSILTACGADANAKAPQNPQSDSKKNVAAEQIDPSQMWGKYESAAVSGENDAKTLFADTKVQVTFGEESVQVAGDCNGMSGQASLEDGKVELADVGMTQTLIGCPGNRQTRDEWLNKFFESTPSWELQGTTLTLQSDVGTMELEKQPEDNDDDSEGTE